MAAGIQGGEDRQREEDEQHLRLLSVFHYIVGGICGFFACFPLIHVTIGLIVALGGSGPNREPQALGWIFVIAGGMGVCFGWTIAILILLAGRRIAQRRAHTFCFVVAAIECLFMPFGTILGVFTILVLLRPSVKALFGVIPEA